MKLLSVECHKTSLNDKSTLVQVVAWCHQAPSHYLSQCWPRWMSPYGFTRPQWGNWFNTLQSAKQGRRARQKDEDLDFGLGGDDDGLGATEMPPTSRPEVRRSIPPNMCLNWVSIAVFKLRLSHLLVRQWYFLIFYKDIEELICQSISMFAGLGHRCGVYFEDWCKWYCPNAGSIKV